MREPASAAKETYDLIIVGGGIYGAMLCLEASRRGLRSLLLEREDFGGATSFNSLRIIHGGLRYLQSLDLPRFRESVGERQWFLKTFPALVKPLPCLMPLYGRGLCRRSVLRVALWVNDRLSCKRNQNVPPHQHLPPGKVIDADRTIEIFPDVDVDGLKGGAIWHDAFVPDSQRLLIETICWASEYGATALNYVQASQLITSRGAVAGIVAVDRESGINYEYKSNVVVNATGPWCRDFAAQFHQDEPALFKPSLAWNVLLDRAALSDHALAVTPQRSGGHTYFLVPWKGKILAGTGHASWLTGEREPIPSTDQVLGFLNDLNSAVPGLSLCLDDIVRIFSGFLPATEEGSTSLAAREVIVDHGNNSGPQGFYSVSGVKFTTARIVAEKTLSRISVKFRTFKGTTPRSSKPPWNAQDGRGIFPPNWRPPARDPQWKKALQTLCLEEAVHHLDDLILRRTTLWENPRTALEVAPEICELMDWSDSRRIQELARLGKRLLGRQYS
jgi:glycerol-3-phosphate dehydrogenase